MAVIPREISVLYCPYYTAPQQKSIAGLNLPRNSASSKRGMCRCSGQVCPANRTISLAQQRSVLAYVTSCSPVRSRSTGRSPPPPDRPVPPPSGRCAPFQTWPAFFGPHNDQRRNLCMPHKFRRFIMVFGCPSQSSSPKGRGGATCLHAGGERLPALCRRPPRGAVSPWEQGPGAHAPQLACAFRASESGMVVNAESHWTVPWDS